MADKLVVGHQDFVRSVASSLEATDKHSCQEQDGVGYKAMARDLWALGYRFDPEARMKWLIVELRTRLGANEELVGLLNELVDLAGLEATE